MASTLPPDALSNLASSIKNAVTGETSAAEAPADVNKVDKTVESHHDGTTTQKEEKPAVVREDVKRHEHEQVDTVVDKEVHKDHYHTTIQPIKDEKVLPAKHVYKENERTEEIDHRDDTAKEAAKMEAAAIKGERNVQDTTHTKEHNPIKENEHVHHHIHETIQPVIEREVLQEKIVHTTDHVHKVEHQKGEHHGATTAPAITMAEFKKGSGTQTDADSATAGQAEVQSANGIKE